MIGALIISGALIVVVVACQLWKRWRVMSARAYEDKCRREDCEASDAG